MVDGNFDGVAVGGGAGEEGGERRGNFPGGVFWVSVQEGLCGMLVVWVRWRV